MWKNNTGGLIRHRFGGLYSDHSINELTNCSCVPYVAFAVHWTVCILHDTTTLSLFLFLPGPNESRDVSTRAPDSDVFTHSPTQDTESEVHLVTTASPMNIPNHRPVLKGMLFHEHLLTRDFQGDQHFFMRDGSVAGYPTMPGSMSALDAGDAATQVVPHEDAPAFSDIATTATQAATQAATSSLTTFSPRPPRPPLSLPKEKPGGVNMAQPTTASLTTQVTPSNRGSGGENYPVVAPLSTKMEKDEARETPLKHKSNSDRPLTKLTEVTRVEGTPTMSTTIITTTTITQTSGRHTLMFSLTFKRSPWL